uniref:Spondin-like TSP1 domain-containing protein n=1 Tax=Eptatretus burgeri TaxID=7764 RepID=A0A8C4QZI4_EPTBU
YWYSLYHFDTSHFPLQLPLPLYPLPHTDWSSCLLPEGSTCGRGKRFRLPVCWRSDGKAVLQPDCHHLPQLPAPEQSCLVECPTHCRLSDWGSWSPCSHSCGLAGSRQRSRHELVSPRGGGRPCPSQLEQSKPCPARPCFRWQLSHWSDCRVEGGGCGEGIRRRELSCHVFDGTDGDPGWPTEAARCNGVDRLDVDGEWSAAEFDGRSMEEQDYEALMMDSNPIMVGVYSDMRSSCYVPCPGECLVEEWSEWGPCHATCFGDQIAVGAGRQVRSRGVVRPAQGARDTCRADLWETQDCTESTCFTYRWQSGPWRDQRRQVWCQQSDGINVTGQLATLVMSLCRSWELFTPLCCRGLC